MNTLPKIGAIFYILLACLLIIPHPVNGQSDPPRSGIWYASQSTAKESKLAFAPLPTESISPNIKVNQDNSGQPQNETSIIFNETNFYNLVGGANDYRLTFASPGYYYSTDGGQTWDDGLLPLGGSYDAGGDPALACDANGNIYYAHISFDYGVEGSDFPDNGLFVNRSTDGGATWMSSPFIVAQNGDGTGTTYDQPYVEDKPYIACDALAQSAYQNTVYVSWTKYFQEGSPTQIYFSRLVPGQPGFSTGVQISDVGYAQGSIPAVGPGGIVYVIWFKITGSFQGTLQLDQSDDGGSTFGTDQTIVDGVSRLYDVKGTIRANNYPAAAVDNSGSDYNGYVYVVWTDKRLGDPDIYFTRGIPQVNGQLQWDDPKRVNDDTPGNGKDQWFPWITVASDGTIYIIYYDSRADANNILTDVYVATSFDAGENFYQEKVNTQSFDPRIGFNGSFMGDYNGITALPEQAYPFWTDMRSGDDQDV